MINIICVLKTGGVYKLDHVIRLFNSLKRNTTRRFNFLCLTDTSEIPVLTRSIYNVQFWNLLKTYPGWWSKVEIFREDLVEEGRMIYFDLDVVILNNIDDILDYDGDFAMLRDWGAYQQKHGIHNSSIMSWKYDKKYFHLYNDFKDRFKTIHGDQAYISHALEYKGQKVSLLQNYFMGIHSYKKDLFSGLPHENSRIVIFHGEPKPHKLLNINWIKDNWR
jgi:hypothetical protein